MDNENEEKKINTSKFGAGFLLCLLAIIIGSSIAVGTGRKITDNIELESSTFETTPLDTTRYEARTKGVAADVTGIKDERTTIKDNSKEKFILPLSETFIKDYSAGVAVKSNTLGDWRTHNGIDFVAKHNDNVKAIKSGSVSAVYNDKLWGVTVEISHGDSLVAKYCGLKEGTTPKVGDTLEQGETVGAIGTIPCEIADEPHLHFEISVGGKTVDPFEAMNIGQ